MQLFGDETADKLCTDFNSLGIQAEIVHGHPLQEVGAKQSFTEWWGGGKKSIGLIQVAGKNISYVNVIRLYSNVPQGYVEYYLEYLVPLRDTPSSLFFKTELKKRTRSWFSREVVDIQWKGGTLADTLNGDPSLKEILLTHLRQNSQLKIEIFAEPGYRCASIETMGVQKERWLRKPIIRPLSRSMFDCLDRIAGHIARRVTE